MLVKRILRSFYKEEAVKTWHKRFLANEWILRGRVQSAWNVIFTRWISWAGWTCLLQGNFTPLRVQKPGIVNWTIIVSIEITADFASVSLSADKRCGLVYINVTWNDLTKTSAIRWGSFDHHNGPNQTLFSRLLRFLLAGYSQKPPAPFKIDPFQTFRKKRD